MLSDKIREAHAQRARQFMPFAALTGYYDLIRACERITEPKSVLAPDEAQRISSILEGLVVGDIVRVEYYQRDAYQTVEGTVSRIDATYHTLTIVKTIIPMRDIRNIEIITPAPRVPDCAVPQHDLPEEVLGCAEHIPQIRTD